MSPSSSSSTSQGKWCAPSDELHLSTLLQPSAPAARALAGPRVALPSCTIPGHLPSPWQCVRAAHQAVRLASLTGVIQRLHGASVHRLPPSTSTRRAAGSSWCDSLYIPTRTSPSPGALRCVHAARTHASNSPAVTRVAPLLRASRTDAACARVLQTTGCYRRLYAHRATHTPRTAKGMASILQGAPENGDRTRALSHRTRARTLCQCACTPTTVTL